MILRLKVTKLVIDGNWTFFFLQDANLPPELDRNSRQDSHS